MATRIKCVDQHLLNGAGLRAACIVRAGVIAHVVVRKVDAGFQWIEYDEIATPKLSHINVIVAICPPEEFESLLDDMRDFAPLRMWWAVDPNNIDFPIPVEMEMIHGN